MLSSLRAVDVVVIHFNMSDILKTLSVVTAGYNYYDIIMTKYHKLQFG
jgi:hypothetical protein